MKPHSQAVRVAQAWGRIETAAQVLAKRAGVQADGLNATHRDPSLQMLFRMEGLADLLESLPAGAPAKAEKGKQ